MNLKFNLKFNLIIFKNIIFTSTVLNNAFYIYLLYTPFYIYLYNVYLDLQIDL